MNISEAERRINLDKLATKLESLPLDYASFDMWGYYAGGESDYLAKMSNAVDYAQNNGGVDKNECGTIACAIGHGPAAGVLATGECINAVSRLSHEEVATVNWSRYSNNFEELRSDAWEWMFGSNWFNKDNTHRGAAARIRYFLDQGLPPLYISGYPTEDDLAEYQSFVVKG